MEKKYKVNKNTMDILKKLSVEQLKMLKRLIPSK